MVYTGAALGIVVLLSLAAARTITFDAGEISNAAPWLLVGLWLVAVAGATGLMPLDATTWLALPGRAAYAPVVKDFLTPVLQVTQLTFALDAQAAAVSASVAIGGLAVTAIALTISRNAALSLLGLIACVAVAQAILGLVQLALGSPSFLAFANAVGGARASGTFVNKNHFATLLAMALPVLVMRATGHFRFADDPRSSGALRNGWWAVATAVVVAALVSSVSRAGLAAGSVATGAAALAALSSAHELHRRILLTVIVVAGFALSAFSGFGLLMKSIEGDAFVQSVAGRQALYASAWPAALDFFPVGSGLGSFAIAFPRYQPAALAGFYEHAHNDYLQFIFELGALGILILGAWLLAFSLVATRILRSRRDGRAFASPAAACLLGCLALAMHSWFDFPTHIPGLAWIACVLAALSTRADLLGATPQTDVVPRKSRRQSGRSVDFPPPATVAEYAVRKAAHSPAAQ